MPPGPVISCSRRNRGRNTKGTKKILLYNKAATFSFLDKVFGAAHSPPRRGGVSATSKKMDPFRSVADGVVSSARLRRPAELTTNYSFALSRSRFAPVSPLLWLRGIF